LALGWAWHRDRTDHWEEPEWPDDRFVGLRAGQRSDPGGLATWMVPVNPRCPRCLAMLRRLHVGWARRARPERLIALIVDVPRHPSADLLRAIPALPVWWDRDEVWRKRWGHRLYGELIEFDRSGRYLRTVSAHEVLRRLLAVAPTDTLAPATMERGEHEDETKTAPAGAVHRPGGGHHAAPADGSRGG
jgi:hypothetical protein